MSLVPLAPFLAPLGMTAKRGGRPLQPRCSPFMSVGHERRGKINNSERASRFATGTVPPLHHRLGHFGHRNVDASDGASLGHDHAHDFRSYAWVSSALRRLANVGTDNGRG